MTKIEKLVMRGFKSFQRKTAVPFFPGLTAIVGENGSGKCVSGESLVQLSDSRKPIKDIVESALEKGAKKETKDGYITKENPNSLKVQCLNLASLEITTKPVKAFVKREAPDPLYKIRTSSGREITATSYHPVFTLEDGEIKVSEAEELEKGKKIAVPRKLQTSDSNLLNPLLDSIDKADNLYVSDTEEVKERIKSYREKYDALWKEVAEDLGVKVNVIKGILDGQSVNLYCLIKILRKLGDSDKEILKSIETIKSRSQNKEIRLPNKNTKEFAQLLGYLLAEGQSTTSNQLRFTNCDSDIIERYINLMEDVFSSNSTDNVYKEKAHDILTYSKPIQVILDKFGFRRGGGTAGKTLTNLFFSTASEDSLASLLSGLFDGDAYFSSSGIYINFKSKELARAIYTVLLMLNIQPNLYKKEKKAINTGFEGIYWTISIYGSDNFKRLQKLLRLESRKKEAQLEELASRNFPNPNKDLLDVNPLIKDLSDDLGIKVHSRSYKETCPKLGAYYRNICQASRDGVQEVLEKVIKPVASEENKQVGKLERYATSDLLWDEVEEVEEVGSEKWVYDLCVEGDHNFIANDIVVHNSNIIDGLSFVLGRRSSKIRAKRLEQLIFNGGKGRKPSDHAYVTLHLDNEEEKFDEFVEEEETPDTITIGRKVTRNSSTYKFMGKNCKYEKIDDILNKAEIDPSGYHFIEQGEITKIIKKSPKQRREIIDEISGIKSYEEKKEKAMEELEEAKKKLDEHQVLIEERKERLEQLEDEKETAEKYKKLEEDKKALENSIVYKKQKDLNKELENLKEKKKNKEEKKESLKEKLDDQDEKLKELEEELEEIEEKIEDQMDNTLMKDIEHLKNKIVRKKEKIESKRNEIERIKETMEEIKRIRKKKGSKAVKAVLNMDKEGVYGTVRDLMHSGDKYSVAIETAAGGHMNDVIVDSRETAIDCVNYLKRNNIGRVRFLPLDKLKTWSHSSKSKIAHKMPGVIDYAINLVDYDSEYEKAFKYVFRDTLVSEDLESVEKAKNVRVVTLDGDIMSKGGAVTGGSKKKKKSKSGKNFNVRKKKKKIESLEKEVESLKEEIGELNQVLEEKKEKEENQDQVSEELKDRRKEINEKLKEKRKGRERTYNKIAKLRSNLSNISGKIEQLKKDIEESKEGELPEDFKIPEKYAEKSLKSFKSEKSKTLKEMNSLGPVNLRSIDEYKKFKKEYEEFKEKVDKLKDEKIEVENLIEEIESKKKEKFTDALEALSEEFNNIFQKLFDGGKASLELEEEGNIDSGLLMKAKPPEKDPHVIDSLSGGEKTLTAIAFVFAIQEYKPSPFYIMDEIDAALDEKHSKRVSDLLRDYAEDSQLIMVSHNEETVRHADRAYGVSMRDGVSKIRSIDLNS